MKSVMRAIVRIVIANKRNWTDTLAPKGTESDHDGWTYIMGNGQMILVLETSY